MIAQVLSWRKLGWVDIGVRMKNENDVLPTEIYCTGCDKPRAELRKLVSGGGIALTNGEVLASYICDECIDEIRRVESQLEEEFSASEPDSGENNLICSFCNQVSEQRPWLLCQFYNVSTKENPDGELQRVVHYKLFHAAYSSAQLMGNAVICRSCVNEVQKAFNAYVPS